MSSGSSARRLCESLIHSFQPVLFLSISSGSTRIWDLKKGAEAALLGRGRG